MHPRWFHLSGYQKVTRLVENRTVFGGEDTQFCIYDTFSKAESVLLRAEHPTICGMVSGKKIIHAPEIDPFEFVPNESLVLPANIDIFIDFPEATQEKPTKCLTIEISQEKLREISARLNETAPRSPDSGEWNTEELSCYHFENTPRIIRLLDDLVDVFTEQTPYRDLLIDGKICELMIRISQSKAIDRLLHKPFTQPTPDDHSLSRVADYVRKNVDQSISVEDLCRQAHMSKTKLFRYFKREFGITPIQFINQQRVEKACQLLKEPNKSVTDVSYEMGFSSMSYFITLFKQHKNMTPKQYQSQVRHQLSTQSRQAKSLIQSYSSVG